MLFLLVSNFPEVVVGQGLAGVAKEFLKIGIFHSVFVHDRGGVEAELVGGAVFLCLILRSISLSDG